MIEKTPDIILCCLFFITVLIFVLKQILKKQIKVSISINEKTVVKFGQNFEFTVEKVDNGIYDSYHHFIITDIKGAFEITKITENFRRFEIPVSFTKNTNTFRLPYTSMLSLTFYWSHIHLNAGNESNQNFANTENAAEKQNESLKAALLNNKCQKKEAKNFVEKASISPNEKTIVKFGDNFEFNVEKIDGVMGSIYHSFQIKNTKGDFKVIRITENYDMVEMFVPYIKYNQTFRLSVISTFDLTFHITANVSSVKEETESESMQVVALNESRPPSVTTSPSTTNESSVLYKIGTNDRYADVFFVTSEGTRIPSHRCILAEFSPIFAKIFDEVSETPVMIQVEDIEADTVKAGLQSLYGKNDAIDVIEPEVFKFAVKYGIQKLIEQCRARMMEFVDPVNVCEYIQIAYENNFEALKQKCLKILIENRKEIVASKIASLPQNILTEAFCF